MFGDSLPDIGGGQSEGGNGMEADGDAVPAAPEDVMQMNEAQASKREKLRRPSLPCKRFNKHRFFSV